MLVVRNDDRPGMIGAVGTVLGAAGVSISSMAVGPAVAGGTALMVLTIDGPAPGDVTGGLLSAAGIHEVHQVDLGHTGDRARPGPLSGGLAVGPAGARVPRDAPPRYRGPLVEDRRAPTTSVAPVRDAEFRRPLSHHAEPDRHRQCRRRHETPGRSSPQLASRRSPTAATLRDRGRLRHGGTPWREPGVR